MPEWVQFCCSDAFLCSCILVEIFHEVWPMYVAKGEQGQFSLYTPFFSVVGFRILFLAQMTSLSLVPKRKKVWHPALLRVRRSWLLKPGMKGRPTTGRFSTSMSGSSGCVASSFSANGSWEKSRRVSCSGSMKLCEGFRFEG